MDQIEQIKAWLAGELHADHDTFAMGKGFAEAVIDVIDKLRDQNYRLWSVGQRICNGNGTVKEMGVVLDSCRPPNDLGAAPLDPLNPMEGF